MYLLADVVTSVACSHVRAFEYAANLENFANWFPGVVSIAPGDDSPAATIGKEYTETVSVPLRGTRSVTIRVTDAVAPHCIATQGDLRPLLPRMEMDILRTGPDTCEVRWRMMSRNENRLATLMVLPVAARVIRRRATTGLRNLKLQLETEPGDTTGAQQITPDRRSR
ncbi:SRPBCC family protein [Mycolicibacterium sp. HK-90]|uniref:SRPBCC family protein n=1 Tax=Mycolicibacterium sp. HK-90 TaxID=3056937 RepID=UPI0026597166|nr:SRPBCC family protein [Mycolicibacterium sp. HK-90]WKG00787.1 SRPBCC family protein [Mycolicibacterium sp. HK-90]